MDDPAVTIIIRSFNEGWALKETLASLQKQDYLNWELIVIDSGSTDGSIELIENTNPKHFIRITPSEYHPPRVLNLGMTLSDSEFNIFLNADATPQGSLWLRPLVAALQKENVAAVYGRQIPRPDCKAVFANDYDRCFGKHRPSRRWEHFFSMVSSGIRKSIWSKRGFSEKMKYSEDDEYTRWCVSHGWKIEYCPDSVVMHSHNYSPSQTFKRHSGEGEALALMSKEYAIQFDWVRMVGMGFIADTLRDFRYCIRSKRLNEWPHAVWIRAAQRTAKYSGYQHGLRKLRHSKAS